MQMMILFLIGAFLTVPAMGQLVQGERATVTTVKSWKTGTGQICPQTVNASLDSAKPDFEKIVEGTSGRSFVLRIIHDPLAWMPRDNWQVELREIYESRTGGKSDVGDNLLLSEEPGPGGDYFPREAWIGVLYPKKPSARLRDGTPLIDGVTLYPIEVVRKIQVEGFFVIIEVKSYSISKLDLRKVNALEVVIELTNSNGSGT